jgi:hypothetical protein
MDVCRQNEDYFSQRLGGGQKHQLKKNTLQGGIENNPGLYFFCRDGAKEDIMTDTRGFVSEVKRKIEKRHEEIVKFRVIAEVQTS